MSDLPICDECSRPITDTDAGPSCGAHDLHSWCDPEPCRWCRLAAIEAGQDQADDLAYDQLREVPC